MRLDSNALRQLREKRLRRTVELCFAAHPFYRLHYQQLGLNPGDIQSLDDLQKLPLVQKDQYMANPEDFRLRVADVPDLSFEEKTFWNVAYTTGTTSGKPSPFFNTTHDHYQVLMQSGRCSEAEGIGRGDLIANLIPLSPMPTGGFLVVGRTGDVLGVPVVSAMTGARHPEYPIRRTLDEAIDCMVAADPTVFWGIPSFVRHFFRRARERGAKFGRARMALVTGEPTSAALRRELTEHLRAFGAEDPQVRIRYSCTEMQGGFVQCRNEAAPQNLTPELYFLEVVNPETGQRVPDGEEGAMALTHLHRRGTVFLRYLVGDLIALRMGECPHCGRLGEQIVQSPRRTGSLLKVKGMLINPDLVLDALSGDRAIREYQLIVRKSDPADPDSMDRLVVRLEADTPARERLAAEIPGIVRQVCMVRPEVEFAGPGEIHDRVNNLKSRMVVDERKR